MGGSRDGAFTLEISWRRTIVKLGHAVAVALLFKKAFDSWQFQYQVLPPAAVGYWYPVRREYVR